MATRWRGLRPWLAPVGVLLAAAPALVAGAASQPSVLPPPISPPPEQEPPPSLPAEPVGFFPGVWSGSAVGAGSISGHGTFGFTGQPFIVTFEFEVAADGTVVNGVWTSIGEASMAAEGVEGSLAMVGSGTMSGSGARVEYSGVIHQSGSMTVQGNVIPVETDVPAAGVILPSSVTCAVATGDLSTESRPVVEGLGFATTGASPFTAQRIASPDSAADFQDQYVQLVQQAEGLIAAGLPAAQDVVALAQQAEDFYQNVFASASCADGAPNLLPGKQPYAYFAKVIGELVLTALANADAYTVDDLNVLAIAALRIGAIGAAAPDPVQAEEIEAALFNTLVDKLAAAIAAQDKDTCVIISLTAATLGMTEIVTEATACTGGG